MMHFQIIPIINIKFTSTIFLCLSSFFAVQVKAKELSLDLDQILNQNGFDVIDTVNIGKINRGETRTHEFKLTNETSSSMIILGVGPSCPCITANIGSYRIETGKNVFINVTLDTKEIDGSNQEYVAVDLLGEDETTALFIVNFEVIEPPSAILYIEEDHMDLGLIAVGSSRSIPVNITNKGKERLSIQQVGYDNSLDFVLDPKSPSFPLIIETGGSRTVNLLFTPSKAYGIIYRSIQFESNSRNPSQFNFSAYVASDEEIENIIRSQPE